MKVARQVPRHITVSENSKKDIVAQMGVDIDTLNVVPVGVDQEQFRPLPHIARVPGRMLTTASADVPLKGLTYLIEALAKVRTEREDAHLVVIGQPRHKSAVPAQLERLGLTDAVQFVSGITDERVVELYAEAEIAVVPSLYEGFSLPAIEAMACGVPLVTTTGGALPEVVGPSGGCAMTVPTADAGALAHQLVETLERRRAAGPARRGRPAPRARPLHLAQDRRGHRRAVLPRARSARAAALRLGVADVDGRLPPAAARARRAPPRSRVGRRAPRVPGDAPRRARHRARLLRRRSQRRRRGRGRDDRSRRGPHRPVGRRGQRRRARPPVPERQLRPGRSSPRCSSTSGTTSARSSRSCACSAPAAASRRRCRPAGPSGSRGRSTTATTTRPARHVRIYRQHELEQKVERAGCFLRGSHHAHAFHSPYWWLKCAYGLDNPDAAPVKRYHEFLCHLIEHNPRVGARDRAGAQPGARQEPRRVRREGPAVGRQVGEAQPWLIARSPKSPASSPARRSRRRSTRSRRCSSPTATSRGYPGGHTDPWNLVEAAMALDVGGRFAEAERAYDWLRAMQHPSGSWHAYYEGDAVKEHTLDTNVDLLRRQRRVAPLPRHRRHRLPRRALPGRGARDRLRARQPAPDRRDRMGRRPATPRRQGRAAHRLVEHLLVVAVRDRGRRTPRTRPPRLGAVARLARHRDRAPARALPRQGTLGDGLVLPDPRPACCAATRPKHASRRSWDTFVAPGRGVRCVSDQPWITAAETCELVMALDAIGLHDRARDLFASVQFLRHDDGSYWTGMNFPDDRFDEIGRLLHARTADLEQRGRRARGERARRHRPDLRAVPRRGPARRA